MGIVCGEFQLKNFNREVIKMGRLYSIILVVLLLTPGAALAEMCVFLPGATCPPPDDSVCVNNCKPNATTKDRKKTCRFSGGMWSGNMVCEYECVCQVRYFYIQDQKHKKDIVAGDRYDNHVYHQDPNGRPNAIWRVEENVKTKWNWILKKNQSFYVYTITDSKHGKAIVAGDDYDNHVYHQDPNGRPNAEWLIYPVPGKKNVFTLVDFKHGKAIVAGDDYDNHVYHQDPNGRPNAEWHFINASPDLIGGYPRFWDKN
jgi:hypothetical protein